MMRPRAMESRSTTWQPTSAHADNQNLNSRVKHMRTVGWITAICAIFLACARSLAQDANQVGSTDSFNVNRGGPILAVPQADNRDPVRCFDHVLRDAINATQAHQLVYAEGWKQEVECHGRAPRAAELESCWALLLQARPVIEQAAQSFESARRTYEPTSGELVHKGNALIKQTGDLLAQARRCFQPVFAKWQQNGARIPASDSSAATPVTPQSVYPTSSAAPATNASMADVYNAAKRAAEAIKAGDTGPNVLEPVQKAHRNLPSELPRPIACYDMLVDALSKRPIRLCNQKSRPGRRLLCRRN
jgi:hypothetical protein